MAATFTEKLSDLGAMPKADAIAEISRVITERQNTDPTAG